MRAFVALIFQFILRGLVRNKVRSIITVLGIALGVAVMLAINLANSSALSKFSESIDLVSGKTTLSIVARTDADLSQSVLQKLSWLYDEEIKFTPVIDQIIVSAKPPNEVAQLLGVDIFADKQFRQFNTGFAPDGGGGFEIFRRGRVFVGSELARRQNLKAGGTFNLFINDKEVPCTVAGVLSGEGLGKAFAGNIVIMDISCAQDLLNMGDRITRIDLIVPPDRIDEVSKRIAKDLPPSAAVERPQRRGEQVEKMLRSFQYNLTALSLIALLVGMFLIYNTMSISVIRRRWEIGTMRALGASVNTVFLLFISEAAILGVLGSALGVAGGLFFARFTVAAVSRTVQALYADQPSGAIIVEPSTLLIAFAAGTALTIFAAMAPAFEAVSIPPAEAARRSSYEQKIQRQSPVLAGIGVLLLIIALVASFQEAVGGFPIYGYVAAALSVFGFAAMTPLLLDFILRMLAPLLAQTIGTEARLAALSLHGALGRTSVAVASLMVGIAMMVSLAVMIGSFRNTVNTWVNQTLRADLWLEPAGRNISNRAGRLTPEVVSTIRKVAGIDAVDAFIEFPIEYNGLPANFGAGEIDVMIKHGNLSFVNGEPSSTVLRRVVGKDAGIVSESFALRHKVSPGDLLTLQSPSGPFPVRVEGVYYDYSSDSGFIIVPRETFAKHY
mgnify:CR=1 FL=1